jgi:hypothetical protein
MFSALSQFSNGAHGKNTEMMGTAKGVGSAVPASPCGMRGGELTIVT